MEPPHTPCSFPVFAAPGPDRAEVHDFLAKEAERALQGKAAAAAARIRQESDIAMLEPEASTLLEV